MGFQNLFACSVVVFLSACAPGLENQFRNEGVGTSLYNHSTAEHTANLKDYFENLCEQADFPSVDCAPPPGFFAPTVWKILVETGYNDIDYRCDNYLNWIETKRSERIWVDSTSTALGTLVGGVLGVASASAKSISYTALALGFAESLYDAYYSRILLGLESSTIKEIVNKGRIDHRKEFAKYKYNNRPQTVFALRRYLTICTPQSIVSNVNIYSRDVANGIADTARRNARAEAQLIPTSSTPAGPGERNYQVLNLEDKVARIFDGGGFTLDDVKTVQKGSCLRQDADVGNATIAAVQIIEQTMKGSADQNGKLNNTEWKTVAEYLAKGCQPGMRNFYENFTFGPDGSDDQGAGFVTKLRQKNLLDASIQGTTLPQIREALPSVRKLLETQQILKDSFYGGADVSKQVTPKLHEAVVPSQ